MEQLTVELDEETARRVVEFAQSVKITPEEAAARLLTMAANVRELLEPKGLLAGGTRANSCFR